MEAIVLAIGNKNLSSWSLRPWLALRHAGIPFEERMLPFGSTAFHDTLAREFAPARLVPAMRQGDRVVWESLAICEHVATAFPEARLWPEDPAAAAFARSIAAEMHGGFAALRKAMPMNLCSRLAPPDPMPAAVEADVARILDLWQRARTRFGAAGPFLCGSFSIADAMYAPVATRFRTYRLSLPDFASDYVETVHALPAMREWTLDAAAEVRANAPGAA